jgi:hypothetical protein
MLLFNIILIGEALADGSTIPWKHFNAFDGMTEDQIQNMTIEEVKAAEDESMVKNAWKVCEDVCSRIHSEPAPSGDMTAYATQKEGLLALYSLLIGSCLT